MKRRSCRNPCINVFIAACNSESQKEEEVYSYSHDVGVLVPEKCDDIPLSHKIEKLWQGSSYGMCWTHSDRKPHEEFR